MNRSFIYILLLITFFFISVSFLGVNGQTSPQGSSLVWTDDHGEGRNLHVFSDVSIMIDSVTQKAELNVYADSRYILSINGVSLSYGPLRSFVNNPVYDTYDLTNYLQKGENIIGVMVRSNGTNTYQVMLSKAGFIAWGEVLDGEKSYSLATPGNWKALRLFRVRRMPQKCPLPLAPWKYMMLLWILMDGMKRDLMTVNGLFR
jgi:hypothetical protein